VLPSHTHSHAQHVCDRRTHAACVRYTDTEALGGAHTAHTAAPHAMSLHGRHRYNIKIVQTARACAVVSTTLTLPCHSAPAQSMLTRGLLLLRAAARGKQSGDQQLVEKEPEVAQDERAPALETTAAESRAQKYDHRVARTPPAPQRLRCAAERIAAERIHRSFSSHPRGEHTPTHHHTRKTPASKRMRWHACARRDILARQSS
jgi:hypothetical protein